MTQPGGLAEEEIQCPFCGEWITSFIDCSEESQSYIEDCTVCCRPIEIFVQCDPEGNLLSVNAGRGSG